MTDKARLGAGDIKIELDGEERTLKSTLRAARTISQQFGGFQKAFDSVAAMDLEAFIAVISAGVGAKPSEAQDIAEKVWSTGIPDLINPVVDYLTILANGGRPVTAGGEEQANPPGKSR